LPSNKFRIRVLFEDKNDKIDTKTGEYGVYAQTLVMPNAKQTENMSKKMTFKQKISLQTGLLSICLVLMIPTANNETILNFMIPTLRIGSKTGSGIFYLNFNLVLLIIATFSFFRLRDNLKQINSKWRYLLYLLVFVWLTSNIQKGIGEKVMTFRKGFEVIELQFDKSEIKYNKDSLGIIHAEGNITFRNYSSDTVVFKGILYHENFGIINNDTISDIILPTETSTELEQYIKIPPKTTYSYPVKFDSKLKVCNSTESKYNGTINRITRFTIYSDNDKKTFEY